MEQDKCRRPWRKEAGLPSGLRPPFSPCSYIRAPPVLWELSLAQDSIWQGTLSSPFIGQSCLWHWWPSDQTSPLQGLRGEGALLKGLHPSTIWTSTRGFKTVGIQLGLNKAYQVTCVSLVLELALCSTQGDIGSPTQVTAPSRVSPSGAQLEAQHPPQWVRENNFTSPGRDFKWTLRVLWGNFERTLRELWEQLWEQLWEGSPGRDLENCTSRKFHKSRKRLRKFCQHRKFLQEVQARSWQRKCRKDSRQLPPIADPESDRNLCPFSWGAGVSSPQGGLGSLV